jgi:hypothetical protein
MRPLCGKKHGGNRKSQGALARLCEFPGRFRFTALKGRSRVSTLHPGLYKWLREGARRDIGATAKPLYPIDGKAAGLDRRNPKTSLFEGGGPPAGGGRSPQTMIPPRSPTPHSSCEFGFFFICFICPKHMMFFFKNHQVSFRRMSKSSACFFSSNQRILKSESA